MAAQAIVIAEAVILLILGLTNTSNGPGIVVFTAVGAVVLLAGGIRMGRDRLLDRRSVEEASDSRRVPWDWTDFVMFWPGAFVAGSMLFSLLSPVASPLTSGGDKAVQDAVKAFIEQLSSYGGALFNIAVLAGLRRGATLHDFGWRRFRWWWVFAAVGVAAVTLFLADELQLVSQHLFPNATNSQCVAVQHD